MARSTLLASTLLLGAALVPACVSNNPGDDPQTSTTSGNPSGSVTSAPGSGPTMVTMTSGTSDGAASTSDACDSACEDMPIGSCDPWAQDCPEGQKCTAYISGSRIGGWDALQCVDVTGTDKPGDKCTADLPTVGADSCIKGAMCWGVNQEGVGTCVALCAGSDEAPVCPGLINCTISTSGVLNLCLPECNPLLQECDPPEACYPSNGVFVCAPDASGEEGQASDPCESSDACDKGLFCADAAFVGAGCPEGCCTPFCELPAGTCPNPDQKCVELRNQNYPGWDIGACGVPG